jgi:glycosyltransferase involved in cell wall biosynthesis
MRKVVFVFAQNDLSGHTKFVAELARELDLLDYECVAYVPVFTHFWYTLRVRKFNFKIHRWVRYFLGQVKNIISQKRFGWAGKKIYNQMKVKRFLILPKNEYLSSFDYVITSAGWHLRELNSVGFHDFSKILHVIHHPHTNDFEIEDDVFRKANFPLVVSSDFTREICHNLGYRISETVLLGVNKDFLNFNKMGSTNEIKIGFFYRDVNRKNPKLILETMTEFHNQHDGIQLHVFGSGFHQDLLPFRVFPKQNLSEFDYINELSQMDIFVYISKVEGFGLPPLEAMALGIPVIASDVGAISEFITTGVDGIIMDTFASSNDFCKQLSYLISNDAVRVSLGSKARIKASTMTWKSVAEKYSRFLT